VNVALFLFLGSIAIIVYTYIVFPLLLIVRGLIKPMSHKTDTIVPSVSLIIAAYNESESVEAKIKNIKALDYPLDKFEVIIGSDGSDDGTNELIRKYKDKTIQLFELPRQGKADTLNSIVKQATGDILVFSDANSLYAPDAIQKLVQHFADEQIGGVAGNQRYITTKDTQDNIGETSYWSFDRQLKIWESVGGSVISATGAIYAIRRELFQSVPLGVTDDFVTSVRVIAQGYRLVYEPNAVAYENVAKDQKREFRRKVRVMTRGFNAVLFMAELLNPLKYGFYALQLFTHKVLRRLLYIPMILIFLSNIFLLSAGWIYVLTFVSQLAIYTIALLGAWMIRYGIPLPKIVSLITFACMVYLAAIFASWNVLRGNRITLWSTDTRQEG
jgi:cellulose synthase/poly-beta-1,6-N-acetylglucosamine synthase-like glycosyltransferase